LKNSKLPSHSFLHAFGVLIYTALIVLILNNAPKIFGQTMNYLGALALLLLFVLSATIVGALILARPVMLYLSDAKKEAVKMLVYTIGWLLLFTSIAFIILLLIK
jgi:hypothetical protein